MLFDNISSTYIDEVFGVKNIRDLVAEQILLSSSKPLNVDMLDDHLQTQILLHRLFHPKAFYSLLFEDAGWSSSSLLPHYLKQ